MVVLVLLYVVNNSKKRNIIIIQFECLTSSILSSYFAITLTKIELPSSNLHVDSRLKVVTITLLFRFFFRKFENFWYFWGR